MRSFSLAVVAAIPFFIPTQILIAQTYEIGTNDIRISVMGGTGDPTYNALNSDVAYNSTNNEYLVVWQSDDDAGGLVDEELEIFGQRIDAETGAEIGVVFRISDMGGTGDSTYRARAPRVAYNSADNEYLVVWLGEEDSGGLVDEELEIFGQRIDAETGAAVGTNDFRISDMGGTGDPTFDAQIPDVAYNSTDNEYLVVWYGDDDTGGLVDDEKEIFGQRIEADTGAEIGSDFRISDMGGTGVAGYGGLELAVAYNSADNEYLVVWYGDDDSGGLVNNEAEIFGQRIDGATGAEVGPNDFRISEMGGTGETTYQARAPGVAYNSTDNEYLVVWYSDDDAGGLVDEEYEIFGQRIEGDTGSEIGSDFRISDVGGTGNTTYNARYPAVAYNSADNEFLVVWYGDDDSGDLVDEELEIFGQRIDATTGSEIGTNDFQISDMGGDGDPIYDARFPSLAYNPTENQYLVVWQGDDNRESLENEEYEIFGQRIAPSVATLFETDLESGSPSLTVDNEFGVGSGLWQLTTLCSAAELGHSAPSALFYGNTATCDYNTGSSEGVATLGPINLLGVSSTVELRFKYLLETEGLAVARDVDVATVEISENGGAFETVASNAPTGDDVGLFDPSGSWETGVVDLSGRTGSSVEVRFHFRTGDAVANAFAGFSIDDVSVITTGPVPIFADGFESSDTTEWSSTVP